MNNELEHLRNEIERLQKIISNKQQADPSTSLIDNQEFLADCARYAEGLYSKADVKKKYRFDDTIWASLAENDELVRAIEAEKLKRVRNGAAKREKAQQLVIAGPDILSSIASDKSASPRHRVDAIKTLDGMSDTGPQTTPAAERFIIQINLGEDYKLKFDKSRAPVANDKDVEIIDDTPQELLTDGNDG